MFVNVLDPYMFDMFVAMAPWVTEPAKWFASERAGRLEDVTCGVFAQVLAAHKPSVAHRLPARLRRGLAFMTHDEVVSQLNEALAFEPLFQFLDPMRFTYEQQRELSLLGHVGCWLIHLNRYCPDEMFARADAYLSLGERADEYYGLLHKAVPTRTVVRHADLVDLVLGHHSPSARLAFESRTGLDISEVYERHKIGAWARYRMSVVLDTLIES